MSQATVTPAGAAAHAASIRMPGVTERNFRRAFFLMVGAVAVFWLGYQLERNVLGRQPGSIRFIREATEAAMRYVTIPHIIIGFLFLVTSPKNRTAAKRAWVVALLIVGAGLCAVYHAGGSRANWMLTSAIYLYFLVHELRDEAMFYTVLGEAPPIPDRRVFRHMVWTLSALLILFAGGIGWIGVPLQIGNRAATLTWPDAFSMPTRVLMALAPVAVASCGLIVASHYFAARLGYASPRALFRAHAPLFRVSVGVICVLGLALLLTQRAYALIIFHVMAWYVFASHQLRANPGKSAVNGWWHWMRTTLPGFRLLHLGMIGVLMVVGLIWTLALGQTPALYWLLAPESFLYWTIMHITVSFVPR